MEQDFVMKTQQFWLHGKILSSSLNFSDLPLPPNNFNTASKSVKILTANYFYPLNLQLLKQRTEFIHW